MLEEALGYAREHGLPKVYVLIDEYDNFTNQLLTAYKDLLYAVSYTHLTLPTNSLV